MGEVCLADDVMLERQVALKFLQPSSESDALDQLLAEARAAAALDHPFICSIYEISTVNDRPCIAMEYVRGETLERRLRRAGAAPTGRRVAHRRGDCGSARGGAQTPRCSSRSQASQCHAHAGRAHQGDGLRPRGALADRRCPGTRRRQNPKQGRDGLAARNSGVHGTGADSRRAGRSAVRHFCVRNSSL